MIPSPVFILCSREAVLVPGGVWLSALMGGPSIPINGTNYGVAAANAGASGNCAGGSPAANFSLTAPTMSPSAWCR